METKRKWIVTVGLDLNDALQPGHRLYDLFAVKLGDHGLNAELKLSGTVGLAPGEAVVVISSGKEQWVYPHINAERVETIIEKHLVGGKPVSAWVEPAIDRFDIPMPAPLIRGRELKKPPKGRPIPPPPHPEKEKSNSELGVVERTTSDSGVETDEGHRWTDMSLIGLGWSIGLAILFGAAGGLWLDNMLGTRPLFTLVGVGLGLVTAAYSAYTLIRRIAKPGQPPAHRPKQQKELGEVIDEMAEVRRQADQRIKEIYRNAHTSMGQVLSETGDRQAYTPTEPTPAETDFIAQARARIAQDKAEAIARLRREYERLAASTGEDAASPSPEGNEKQAQHTGEDDG